MDRELEIQIREVLEKAITEIADVLLEAKNTDIAILLNTRTYIPEPYVPEDIELCSINE